MTKFLQWAMLALVLGLPATLSAQTQPLAGSADKAIASDLTVPVIVMSQNIAKLSSPLTGFIRRINYKAGEHFVEDDVLVEFDCTVLLSERQKAQAAVDSLSVKATSLGRLFKLDGASELELTDAKSQLAEAKAELKIKSYLVSQCHLKAPFKGQVYDLLAEPHEYIEQGEPLVNIVNLSDLELKLIMPSDWLSWLKIGTKFQVFISETQQRYPAKITRLTYRIDPVSNTIIAYGKFTKLDAIIKPGMSGNAEFKR